MSGLGTVLGGQRFIHSVLVLCPGIQLGRWGLLLLLLLLLMVVAVVVVVMTALLTPVFPFGLAAAPRVPSAPYAAVDGDLRFGPGPLSVGARSRPVRLQVRTVLPQGDVPCFGPALAASPRGAVGR